jgi:hypothetical protein
MASLLQQQRRLMATLLVLIATGLVLDTLVRAWGEDVAGVLGVESWLRRTLTRPQDDTLRNLLAAAAGGTATILGLVLSISLIVWQTTADRYRSTTIVDFLLRERTGAAMVRMLALAFAYSLWVLALLELRGDSRPYVSVGMALAISTAAVLSLIGYRHTALLGYLPRSIAARLGEEITTEVQRAQRPGAGRSVERHSRYVVASDFQILDDLITSLSSDGDPRDLAPTLGVLRIALNFYVRTKGALQPQSLFFDRQEQRLSANASEIEDTIASEGLLNPTTEAADHLWFERRILELGRAASAPAALAEPEVRDEIFRLWGEGLQYAWFGEDPDAVDLILVEIRSLRGDPRTLQDPEVAEDYLTLAWLLIEAVGRGFLIEATDVVDARAWEREKHLKHLPWGAQADARELGRRVKREIAIAGAVLTPRDAMVREVAAWRKPRLQEHRRRLSHEALELCLTHLKKANEAAPMAAPVAARMTLRLLLRMAYHELPLPDLGDLGGELLTAHAGAAPAEAEDLRKDAGRAARVLAEHEHWGAAYEMCDVVTKAGWVARSREQNVQQQVLVLFDALFSLTVVYSWAEFHNRTDHLMRLAPLLHPPWVNLDSLIEMVEGHRLTSLMFPTLDHYRWFQPVRQAAFSLPDVAHGSGMAYRTVKDHSSPLFRRSELLFGPRDALEYMLVAVAISGLRARLRAVLIAMREKDNDQ